MHARTLRYHANVLRQFRDSSRRFGELIRKPIANSSHPSEIGALGMIANAAKKSQEIRQKIRKIYTEITVCGK